MTSTPSSQSLQKLRSMLSPLNGQDPLHLLWSFWILLIWFAFNNTALRQPSSKWTMTYSCPPRTSTSSSSSTSRQPLTPSVTPFCSPNWNHLSTSMAQHSLGSSLQNGILSAWTTAPVTRHPQGLMLDPLLFIHYYMLSFGKIIQPPVPLLCWWHSPLYI